MNNRRWSLPLFEQRKWKQNRVKTLHRPSNIATREQTKYSELDGSKIENLFLLRISKDNRKTHWIKNINWCLTVKHLNRIKEWCWWREHRRKSIAVVLFFFFFSSSFFSSSRYASCKNVQKVMKNRKKH